MRKYSLDGSTRRMQLTGCVVLRTVIQYVTLQHKLRQLNVGVYIDWRVHPGEVQRVHRVANCNIEPYVYIETLHGDQG